MQREKSQARPIRDEVTENGQLGLAELSRWSVQRRKRCGFVTRSWPPRQESNLHLSLRRAPFYPLNYGEESAAIVVGIGWLT